MSTFKIMSDRIMAELRRSNLTSEVHNAINDAITEAAKTRFYFNEMHVSFATVASTEYYSDLGLTGLDTVWYWRNNIIGGTRDRLWVENDLDADDMVLGNSLSGQLQSLSRYGGQFRVYPIPSSVVTIYLDGYGKLTPNPLVNDADTNAWMTEGEFYIRALAKRNLFRDVIRDYGEARVYEATAEDYKDILVSDTATRNNTGQVTSTQW